MQRRCAQGGTGSALVLVFFTAMALAQNGANGRPQGNTDTESLGATGVAAGGGPTLAQGLTALRSNEPREALADFQRVLAADPGNAAANLLASTAAVELFEGPLAVRYAEKAEKLDPGNWKIHSTLVAAYSAAGMKEQRDRERALLQALHTTGAPDARLATGFLVEMFPLGPDRVDAIEYFEPVGRFHTCYRFLLRHPDGRRVWEVDVESDDFDQKSWAEAHPTEAAAGARQFQISGHSEDGSSVDYRMFSGKPDYDSVREMVVEALRRHPVSAAQ